MQSTPTGAVFLAVSIALAFSGALFASLSFAVLAVAFASILVYAQLRFAESIRRTDVEVRRTILDEMSFSDEPVSIKLELVNKSGAAVKGTFEDILPEGCELSAGENKVDTVLPGRSMLTMSYSITPRKRGAHRIPGVRLTREDDFGLLVKEQLLGGGTLIEARTKREAIDRARKLARREYVEMSGFARNPAVVLRELEFDGIREYLPGDRARDIHWKLLPKLDKLMTKIYKKEGSVQTMIFVDCGRSMRMETSRIPKLDHAVEISMQLSSVLISSLHPAGVATFDELAILDEAPPALGRHQFEKIVKMLAKVPETVKAEPSERPVALSSPRAALANAGGSREFIGRIESLAAAGGEKKLGFDLESSVKNLSVRSKGQQQLYVVISDLESSREAVFTVAGVCRRAGNKLLVIHVHDDWYREPRKQLRIQDVEGSYAAMAGAIKLESALRALGASYVRIGPADTASGIVRAMRRGRT